MLTMYGIKNCDTIKKARRYLDEQQITYQFHDYRTNGVDSALLESFAERLGYDTLLNTRGTTWRKLSEQEKSAALSTQEKAIALMVEQPSVIKRPLLAIGDRMILGFTPESYIQFLSEK